MKVGYLGPDGSFSHLAAMNVFARGRDLEFTSSHTISHLINQLATKNLDQVIVPVENSIGGGVAETIDALQRTEQIYIYHEYIMPISHCLMAIEKINFTDIRDIHAHPMSFMQCNNFILKHCPGAHLHAASSNSAAALALKSSAEVATAVIGPELSAELYGLEILRKAINDESNNETRFWVLNYSQLDFDSAKDYKTTIVFQTKDESGSLVRALAYFAEAGINLSRIESRPVKKNLGEYSFFLDLDVHKEEERFIQAISRLKKYFSYYKCLGSYSLIK